MIHRILISLFLLFPLVATAQDTPQTEQTTDDAAQSDRDRSWLTGLIEDNLSGDGRTVQLDGFKGAFSSNATFETLTISDADGAWLTIRNGSMAWSRLALLTGRLQINELSAAEIDLARLPPSAEEEAPNPEATPFALPELPVSVDIGKLSVAKLVLGEPVIGQAATFSLEGALSLAGGDGHAKLDLDRTDGVKGDYRFEGGYANATKQLDVDLLVDEGDDGLVTTLIDLPNTPSMTLSAKGSGPLSDFTADIALATEGQDRVTGKVALRSVTPEGATEAGQGFDVDLTGDITPLVPEEYRSFFGTDTELAATGVKMPDGTFTLSDLSLDSYALKVNGRVRTLASGMPDNFVLGIQLGNTDKTDILLPVSGARTWAKGATLRLFYDRSQGQSWTLSGLFEGLRQEGTIAIDNIRLAGNGLVALETQTNAASGRVNFDVSGITLADPALAQAVGPTLSGSTTFDWTQTHPINLTNLVLNGRDLALRGGISVGNFGGGVDIMPDLVLDAGNLSNYAAVAGMPLAGSIEGTVKGTVTALTGAFDLAASLTGQDLKTGVAEADALLSGQSRIELSAARDEKGLNIRQFNANAATFNASAQGLLATNATDLKAQVQLRDLGSLGGAYRGSANITAGILDVDGERRYTADGTASNLSIGQELADKLLAGNTTLMLRASQRGETFNLTALNLQNPQLSATAESTNATTFKLAARLADIGLIEPKYRGPVTIDGTIAQQSNSYALDLKGAGPGGLQAAVNGTIAADASTSNLHITGRADSALANNFIDPQSVGGIVTYDLRLQGPPGLNALSGQIQTSGASVNVPSASILLQDLDLRATLGNGRVQLDARARMSEGGSVAVSGPVTLSAPFQSDLRVTFDGARLRDPTLYETSVSGGLRISGPLTGSALIDGNLQLGQTEIRVPDSVGGGVEIPDIQHVGASRPVVQTLRWAGLLPTGAPEGGGGGGVAYRLNIGIVAPNRIFVRGRGLDAELGGELRLTGTTANIVPVGHFNLLRGRLDVLAKRFTLTEGQVAMQGTLTPWISFAATTTQGDTSITIRIEGQANEPALTLSSSPDLPDEEILARLLFGKGLTNLSVLQAAQLASAVATLAGKGGDGIISKLRNDFGLDDLDIGTDADGNPTLRAGRYLSKSVYTDVAVGAAGETELNLNLDINSSVTARGTVGSDGESSIGIFYERDY